METVFRVTVEGQRSTSNLEYWYQLHPPYISYSGLGIISSSIHLSIHRSIHQIITHCSLSFVPGTALDTGGTTVKKLGIEPISSGLDSLFEGVDKETGSHMIRQQLGQVLPECHGSPL